MKKTTRASIAKKRSLGGSITAENKTVKAEPVGQRTRRTSTELQKASLDNVPREKPLMDNSLGELCNEKRKKLCSSNVVNIRGSGTGQQKSHLPVAIDFQTTSATLHPSNKASTGTNAFYSRKSINILADDLLLGLYYKNTFELQTLNGKINYQN